MPTTPDTDPTPKPDRDQEQEQIIRFRAEVQKRIDAGELNPTDADAALDNLIQQQRHQ